MLHLSSVDGRAAIPMIERMPFEDRESIRIGYVPLAPVLSESQQLCNVAESVQVLSPDEQWGSIKIGAGTPPVRVSSRNAGWLRFFTASTLIDNADAEPQLRYCAGIVIHDLERPDRVLYRSPQTDHDAGIESRTATASSTTSSFPTGHRSAPRYRRARLDVYYGMGDSQSARAVWL